MRRGEIAEREVVDSIREALAGDADFRRYPNVQWTGPVRRNGPARDGEADVVLAHPDHGVLVLEVKAGEPSIDHEGRWHLGSITLDRSPFEQARTSHYLLRDKLRELT